MIPRTKQMTLYGLGQLFDTKRDMDQEKNEYANAFVEIQGDE